MKVRSLTFDDELLADLDRFAAEMKEPFSVAARVAVRAGIPVARSKFLGSGGVVTARPEEAEILRRVRKLERQKWKTSISAGEHHRLVKEGRP